MDVGATTRSLSASLRLIALVTALVLVAPWLTAGATANTDFTWTGATAAGADAGDWSNATNWQGGTAPSGTVGTLTFPHLTAATCTTFSPSEACDNTNDDIAGLTATAISIDNSPLPTSGESPQLSGTQQLMLGGGGITASTSSSCIGGHAPSLSVPLVLTAPQTWSITGCLGLDLNYPLGPVSVMGSNSDTLALNVNHAMLGVNANVETGAITISGAGGAVYLPAVGGGQGRLNADSGQQVTVNGDVLFSSNGYVGPLTMTGGSFLQLGAPCCNTPPGMLTADGAVTLDPAGTVEFAIPMAGTAAGTDYGQLDANSNSVNLADTNLDVEGGSGSGCPSLNLGDVDTIVEAGSITGTFSGVPDGTVVPVVCVTPGGQQPYVRINYGSTTVAATVVPEPPNVLSVTKLGTGSGTVTSSPAGIDCGSTCSEHFGSSASVTLKEAPAAGSTFAGWGGACSGTGSCTVQLDSSRTVTATFNAAGAGQGGTAGGLGRGGKVSKSTVTANQNGVVTLPVQNPNPVSASGNVTLTAGGGSSKTVIASKAKKRRKKTVRLGHKSFSAPPNSTVQVKVRLSKAGRTLLKQQGRVKAKVTIVLAVGGRSKTTTQTITIKASAKKKHRR